MALWFGVAAILVGLAWHIPALAFGGEANVPDIVIMVVVAPSGLQANRGCSKSGALTRANFISLPIFLVINPQAR